MKLVLFIFSLAVFSCSFHIPEDTLQDSDPVAAAPTPVDSCLVFLHSEFKTGAEQMPKVVEALKGKTVGLVGNQSSLVNDVHLVDTLLGSGIDLQRIFCPEHGFRGKAAAGEKVDSSVDKKTGLPIISLYGKHKKPTAKDLSGLDVLVFDIQDVGARFYTYISTLHYVMEAAAEHGVNVLVLDRPNPNGHVVDGPVLKSEFQSFIGMHEVPVLHGMTIGEYAKMISGEGWLNTGLQCNLMVIPCLNYSHKMRYELPVKPSPNLSNTKSIYAYASLCFFEGTAVSVGRGTDVPFQIYGHPEVDDGAYTFTPKGNAAAPKPKLEGELCKGYEMSESEVENLLCNAELNLSPLLSMYATLNGKTTFFTRPDFFDLLAGSDELRKQMQAGLDETAIRESWVSDLERFRKIRAQYLLYP